MSLLPIKLLSVVWAVEIPCMNRLCYMNSTSGYAGLRRFIGVQAMLRIAYAYLFELVFVPHGPTQRFVCNP